MKRFILHQLFLFVAAGAVIFPASNSLADQPTKPMTENQIAGVCALARTEHGKTKNGKPVARFTLTNAAGHSASVSEHGATLLDVNMPDRDGKLDNVNLMFDSLQPYLGSHPYFGSTVGRFCNRIAKGQFVIDGSTHQVTVNLG
ncbi:MAG: hypothetical protein AAFN70_21200, partial [Planctomycetota bacterium]